MDSTYEYLQKFALKAPDDSSIKGVPGIDKSIEEEDVVAYLLNFLGVSERGLAYEPSGPCSPPDFSVRLSCGRCLGVEVTELVYNDKIRAERQRYHEAEVKLGLRGAELHEADILAHKAGRLAVQEMSGGDSEEVSNVYWDAFAKNHPARRRISRELEPAIWSVEELAGRLDKIIARKDDKLRAVVGEYSEIFLVLFTGYSNIDFELLMKASYARKQKISYINRVFLVLERPILADWYPVVEF